MTTATRKQIEDFWTHKRIAVVGVSRDPKEISYMLWQELRQRRYDALPVNPNVAEMDGQRCYARVQEIQPPVDGVLIMTPAGATEGVVKDCAEAGVDHVWMYGGWGRGGAVSREALEFCAANGIDVVPGLCPYMFLPGTPFFHSMHAWVKKVTGSYPK